MAKERIDLDEVRQAIESLGLERTSKSVQAAARASFMAMLRDTIANRMSGQELGIVTGTARKSMRGFALRTSDRVIAAFGSPLRYVRAHEEGFSGPVNVRAHEREGRSGKQHHVRAHVRQANIRARHFMRHSLQAETRPKTGSRVARRIIKALSIAARTGRIPVAGELGV